MYVRHVQLHPQKEKRKLSVNIFSGARVCVCICVSGFTGFAV